MSKKLSYQRGLGNYLTTEARPGSLPATQNSPQKPPSGLYAEQISGSAFTTPRVNNLRTWLYRMRPSVMHGPFQVIGGHRVCGNPIKNQTLNPNQLRWGTPAIPTQAADFITGLTTFASHGSIEQQRGAAIHLYNMNDSMHKRYFSSADGECLFVPQQGELRFKTEMGVLDVAPGEILVIPRGVKFQIELLDASAQGYICENYAAPFRLPELGPIGANGLANPRHFLSPVAAYEDQEGKHEWIHKFHGQLWSAPLSHSPLDVVAWHGNYAPYKYDLSLFNVINSVSFDHPDPSIFTVLTSQSDTAGVANVDFVIFPPRWAVAEHTFRPPYFHRNIMSEFMGLIHGVYDAKTPAETPTSKNAGFVPGGASLHNCMTPHGPDTSSYQKAVDAKLKPEYMANTLAFMFESRFAWVPTEYALQSEYLQNDYQAIWQGFEKQFK